MPYLYLMEKLLHYIYYLCHLCPPRSCTCQRPLHFTSNKKKADHCLSEGGEEWRAAAMHGLYDLLKSGTETRPYQELGSSTPTPPTYPPNPNPSGWDSSRCSGKQAIWKTEPVWVTRWYFVLLSFFFFFFWDAYGLKLCVFILNIRGFLFLALI